MNSYLMSVAIFTILIVHSVHAWDVSSLHDSSKKCAELYFQPLFQGAPFRLNDDQQISDLSDLRYYLERENEKINKNRTHLQQNYEVDENGEAQQVDEEEVTTQRPSVSFRVSEQCQLKLSPRTFLKGEVTEFRGDVDNLDWINPESAACECSKPCKCEDHKLRRTECARIYLKDDCTNCKAIFTSLSPGSWREFPEKWSGDAKTILIRPGCDVSLDFSTSKASKNIRTFSSAASRTVKDVNAIGNITRYECTCTSTPDTPENVSNRNPNYPPLINIPKTKGAINTLMFKTELKNHPGLIASLQSLRNRRNSKNAYILLLGLTGSGKSSAVNLLFDHPNITKVGDYVSTTSDILQFTIPVKVDELGMNNTALHVIDTPGIGDTRGIAEDAKFLASLDDFLSKNEDLRRNLPNVVLIFSKFSDNRYRGEGSSFVKMLRTIDLFKDRIIDKKSTNVIFVLSHYMSETKETIRDPSDRIDSIRQVIQEFSTLPRPIHIVLAENKPEEAQLPSINGFFRLPNGDFYPKNLFDQMERNLIDRGDPVGESIIRTAFSNSDSFKISGKRIRLLHPSNAKVTKYLGMLGSFNTPVSNTEVSNELNKAYQLLDENVKMRYPEILNTLQRTLYMRNLYQMADFPQTTDGILKLLQEVQLNPATLFLLENAFNITIPDFKGNFIVGSGYSLSSDRVLPASVFKIDGNNSHATDLLLKFPETFTVRLQNQLDNHFQVFTSRDEYIHGRMQALGLADNPVPTYTFSPSKFPGFNLISLENVTTNIHWNTLSATVNYQTFEIRLSEHAELAEEFLTFLNRLQPLNVTDYENVQRWSGFFDKYGTHVVGEAAGGGSIKVKVALDESEATLPNAEKFSILSESMGHLMQQLANELIGKDASYVPPPRITYEFSQSGGNRIHFWGNFSELDETKNVDQWRESLKYDPVILTTRLQLVPISEIVKEYMSSRELGYMIEEAASSLLNASLVFIPIQRVGRDSDNPESRELMTSSSFRSNGDFESMQEFANMFKAMSESTNKMQSELIKVLTDSQQKQHLQEEEWQRERLRMEERRAEQDRIYREEQRADEDRKIKREEIELQRIAQENAFRVHMEQNRMQMEMQQATRMEEVRSQNQRLLLDFINQENDRKVQIMKNRKGWLDKTLDFLGGTLQGMSQGVSSAAPLIAGLAG